jgi:hypothetical protein
LNAAGGDALAPSHEERERRPSGASVEGGDGAEGADGGSNGGSSGSRRGGRYSREGEGEGDSRISSIKLLKSNILRSLIKRL